MLQRFKTFKSLTVLAISATLVGCSADPDWLKPSGKAITVPDSSLAFEKYVADSQSRIEQVVSKVHFKDGATKSPFVGSYSATQVAKMRAPFQIPADSSDRCTSIKEGASKGFLLIHGLTDSPYLLKNMADSLHAQYPCALIRSVLLPGHGTVIGDTLSMSYQQWKQATSYGVKSFEQEQGVEDLYIVGFSTGTALAIQHVLEGANSQKIKGLVLLSTALKANSGLAWLTPYIKALKPWVGVKKDRDAARYSSFSTNAGAQFYLLTKDMLDKKNQLDIPVLMAVSADDATINAQAARQYFCNNIPNDRKLMLWYQGFSKQSKIDCQGIVEIAKPVLKQNMEKHEYRYANVAHTGVSVSPWDEHYGVQGVYRDCKAYEKEQDDSQWQACMSDSGKRVFGEKNIAANESVVAGGMWRRGTFNKDYEKMLGKVFCFIDQECTNTQLQSQP